MCIRDSSLGGVLYERALIAEREGDTRTVADLIDRLALYDPHHRWRDAWQTPMRVHVTTRPPATVRLAAYRERGGRLELEPARVIAAEALRSGLELAPGSYLLTAQE